MSTLILTDAMNNGKGSILNHVTFETNIFIHTLKIENDKLYQNKEIVDLNQYKTIIFNINEDFFGFYREKKLKKRFKIEKNYSLFLREISQYIKKKFPNIILYHDPEKILDLGNKLKTYDQIKHIENDLFKIPQYKEILSISDIENINYYPVIIKNTVGSSTTNDCLCKDYNELKYIYIKEFNLKKNVFVVQFINSFIKNDLNKYHNIRLLVLNDKLTDYFVRVKNQWKIRMSEDHYDCILKSDNYFKNIIEENKEKIFDFIKKIHEKYGNAFYSYDIIYNNQKFYICEIGLKISITDSVLRKLHEDKKNDYYKISLDKDELKIFYNSIINNDS